METTLNAALPLPAEALSTAARERMRHGETLFYAHWSNVAFLHFATAAAPLQAEVPYRLDLHEGQAYVSLVAFTMSELALSFAPQTSEWLLRPIGHHDFLNVRTYVQASHGPGIYFMREFVSNRLSRLLGPVTYGLPYRYAHICYQHDVAAGTLQGHVQGTGAFTFTGTWEETDFAPCTANTRDSFLLERYTAYTQWGRIARCFHIWHPPWEQTTARVAIEEDTLLAATGQWYRHARCVGANFSPGARHVWMGRPHFVREKAVPLA